MKFDIRKFITEDENDDLEGEQEQDKRGEENSPVQTTQQSAQKRPQDIASQVFADIKGKTIKDIDFSHVGPNSGKIEIYFVDYQVPMVISWVNDKVTVAKPPAGDIYPLT